VFWESTDRRPTTESGMEDRLTGGAVHSLDPPKPLEVEDDAEYVLEPVFDLKPG